MQPKPLLNVRAPPAPSAQKTLYQPAGRSTNAMVYQCNGLPAQRSKLPKVCLVACPGFADAQAQTLAS
ncbi:MAG: hypothetical protein IKS64_02810 [Muribaculaceae bacterium]|nr:hypothetical protein [Muribaculaceae bacterium]